MTNMLIVCEFPNNFIIISFFMAYIVETGRKKKPPLILWVINVNDLWGFFCCFSQNKLLHQVINVHSFTPPECFSLKLCCFVISISLNIIA